MVTNLLYMGADDTIGNCSEMGEPCPSGFDDASHLLIRGNFHWAFEIPVHIMRGERLQLRGTFCREVLSGIMGVLLKMYSTEEKACLFYYAMIPFLHLITIIIMHFPDAAVWCSKQTMLGAEKHHINPTFGKLNVW